MDARLEELPYWPLLNAAERELVRSGAVVRRYPAGSVLHGNCDGGGSCLGMITVLSGCLRVFMISREGREITLFCLRPEERCVLSAACILSKIELDTQLTAQEDSELLVVPPPVYARLMEHNPQVRCYTYELALQRYSTVMHVLQQILFTRFDARLAGFLLQEYRRSGPELHMTQAQLAQNVNSAREVVARALKQFAAAGLIENRRGLTVIRDAAGLERLLD